MQFLRMSVNITPKISANVPISHSNGCVEFYLHKYSLDESEKKITYFCGNNPVKWMNSKLGAHSVTNSHCSNCIHLVVNILPTFGNIERNAHSSFCHLNIITLFSMPNVRDYAVIFLELAQVIRFGTLAKMVIVLLIKRPL